MRIGSGPAAVKLHRTSGKTLSPEAYATALLQGGKASGWAGMPSEPMAWRAFLFSAPGLKGDRIMNEHEVTFLPHHQTVKIPHGEALLRAAMEGGVHINGRPRKRSSKGGPKPIESMARPGTSRRAL